MRAIALPRNLGDNIHPGRLTKFAREGAVAPVNLLSDFDKRRRLASLAAQMLELEMTLTDSAIALFERLTGQLFTRSRNRQDRSWSACKTQARRLIRLFGGAIDAMVRAREQDRDPFDVLDEAIDWDRLVASREESAALGDLATRDPLSLAANRYAQLRRYAPVFLETFDFNTPASGQSLQGAVALLKEFNRTGKRKLPAIVPMPFPSKHWRATILHNGEPQRRTYETGVVATLRDRLRAGDVWVTGTRDYRRFDAYLLPRDEAQRIVGDSALDTDARAWLEDRRDRLREVGAKLSAGRLEGVRVENGRLKITPYDTVTPRAGERLDRTVDALMPRIRITDLLWDVNARTGFLDAFTDLRSGRAPRHCPRRRDQPRFGTHGTGVEGCEPCSTLVGQRLVSASQNLRRRLGADHRRPPRAAVCEGVGQRHQDIVGRTVLCVRTQSRGDQRQVRTRPRYQDLLLPVGALRTVPFQRDRGHRGRGAFRARRVGGQRSPVRPARAPCRYRRGLGPRLRPVSPARPLARASSARLPRSPTGLFRKTPAVEGARSHHGQADPNEDVALEHWNDALRLTASIKTMSVKPSAMLRKLGAYRQQNRLYLALGEIGRIERTLRDPDPCRARPPARHAHRQPARGTAVPQPAEDPQWRTHVRDAGGG